MNIPDWLQADLSDELEDFDYWQWRTADHAVEVALDKLVQRIEAIRAAEIGKHRFEYDSGVVMGCDTVLALIRGG